MCPVSSKVWIAKLQRKNASELALKTIERLSPLQYLIHTIRGNEELMKIQMD